MSLQDNTIAYQLTIHRWGIKRQIKSIILSSMLPGEKNLIEKKMLAASKRIIESPEYDKIVSRDGYATTWLQEHSVPSMLKKGIYLIPTLFCNEVDEYIEHYKYEREYQLLPAFLSVYESQVEMAQLTLGVDLWDSLEYPTPEKMRTLFYVDTCYVTFDVPQSLQFVSDELFRREREKIEQQWKDAEETINQLLVQECAELVEGLQRALTGLNDGTLKRFREANLENLREWSELFLKARNVTENAELESVVLSIKAALANVEREDLKHDRGSLRQHVARELTGIQSELKSLMEHQQERAISFD
jgi:hypothetical protein